MSLIPTEHKKFTYDHIPTLRELMPGNAGLPGVTYGIISVVNQRPAQDEGWGAIVSGKVFTLVGPKGECDVILGCKGSPLRGINPNAGARKLLLDDTIYTMTGLWTGKVPEHLGAKPKEVTPTVAAKPKTTVGIDKSGLPGKAVGA